MAWPNEEPSVAPIWMIGRSRPTAAPVPIENAEASDLMAATTGRIFPSCEVDDEKRDDEAANHRDQDNPRPPRACRRELVGIEGEGEFVEKGDVMNERDQCAEEDGAEAGHHAHDQGQKRKPQKSDAVRLEIHAP